MSPFQGRAVAAAASLAIIAIGALALLGLAVHNVALAAVVGSWVAMKPVTAFCFLIHGSSIYCWLRLQRASTAGLLLVTAAGVTFMIGVALTYSVLFTEQLRSSDPTASICPSGATIAAFLLAAAAELLLVGNFRPRWARGVGSLIGLIGGSTLAGYALGLPALYFFWPGFCTAVAANTGLGFVCLAVSLLALTVIHPPA